MTGIGPRNSNPSYKDETAVRSSSADIRLFAAGYYKVCQTGRLGMKCPLKGTKAETLPVWLNPDLSGSEEGTLFNRVKNTCGISGFLTAKLFVAKLNVSCF
jgi:hypothetical protein